MTDKREGLKPRSIGRENVEIIFQLIQRKGEISRTDIAKLSGLSKTAVSSLVDQLMEEELVREYKQKRYSKVGRKPRLLSVNPNGRHFVSVDIGGSSVIYGLGNLNGELEETKKVSTPDNWKVLHEDIIDIVSNCNRWTERSYQDVEALAIAVPGVVNEDGTVNYAPNIEGLDKIKLREELGKELEIPIFLENDVNASALGEYRERKSKYSNLVFIAIGTGVGAGIIIDGELFKGSTNHAGEVGWFVSDISHMSKKKSGQKGWLENRISGPDIVRRTEERLQSIQDDPLCREDLNLSPKTILEDKYNSPVSREMIEDWIKVVSMLVSNITAIIDPELVILGGGVSKTGCKHLNDIKIRVKKNTQHTPKIDPSKLDDKAPLYGGLALCKQNIAQYL